MTWIHAVKRQGVIAMLSIGLTVPAVGLAGAALADSQGKSAGTPASAKAGSQGAAASNSHAANNGKDNGNNGNGKNAEAASSDSAAQSGGSGNGNSTTVDSPAGCPNSFHNSDSGNGANVRGA